MFRCDRCNKKVAAHTKQCKRIVAKREKTYPGGGKGWETVREESLCPTCSREENEGTSGSETG